MIVNTEGFDDIYPGISPQQDENESDKRQCPHRSKDPMSITSHRHDDKEISLIRICCLDKEEEVFCSLCMLVVKRAGMEQGVEEGGSQHFSSKPHSDTKTVWASSRRVDYLMRTEEGLKAKWFLVIGLLLKQSSHIPDP